MFLISRCRAKSDLGLPTISALAIRMQLRVGDFRLKNLFGRKIHRNSPMHSSTLFASNEVVHRPTSDSLLHFDIRNK